MLTTRGRRTLAGALVAAVLGRIFGIPELFGLAAAAAAVVLAALVRVRLAKGGVTVTARAVPPVVSAGEPALLQLAVVESGVMGSSGARVVLVPADPRSADDRHPAKVVVPRLGRGDTAWADFPLATDRRGIVEAGAYEAAIADPLGLARRHLATSRAARCTVLPRVEPLSSVVPRGLGFDGRASTRSAAERLASGSSLLRRYSPGDDLRRVHWRTTARVGELMVRDGGDPDDPDRIATTVVLDAGSASTPPAELERAIEVAASVLAAAVDEATTAVSGEFRLVTTTGVDSGTLRGHDALTGVLALLAGVAPVPLAGRDRLGQVLDGLGRPERDEVLVIAGAFGGPPPSPDRIGEAARFYAAVVVVAIGAAPPGEAGGEKVDGYRTDGYQLVWLPLGRPLAVAWDLHGTRSQLEVPAPELSLLVEDAPR